ncbi:reverse transcriptase domain, reverse transcriptase zinc-binding domain protein [Tanacetum coccineum]
MISSYLLMGMQIRQGTAYFCNVHNHTKLAILHILPFEDGRLPVKYLGVPLISSRLVYRDCKELIKRIQKRIQDWKNKSLSAARRLQLVQSVLGSMHVYWASVFILPSRILLDIEQLMRGFLWCQGKMMKGKSKVAWEVVCLPKSEGGLGPLSDVISMRDIHRAGFNAVTKVRDIALDGSWHFPSEWHSKYPNLNMPTVPLFTDLEDVLEWRDLKGGVHPFSVSIAWDCIRPRQDKVDWSDVVWFSNYIPRHSFHLWLVIRRKLRTQDTLIHSNAPLLCSLCERTPDSHDHLFFECVFSNQVWDHLKVLAGLNQVSASFASIMSHLVPISKRRHARSVIAKIVVAACSYYIWQERNWRLFRNKKRSVAQLIECIKSSVRLKLLTCRFKKSKAGREFCRHWNLSDSLICT